MNGLEILKTIVNDGSGCKYFGGLMSIDRLNLKPSSRVFYICNTDFWVGKGKHWVVMNFLEEEKTVEFFDPIGNPPDISFIKFMKKYRKEIVYNKFRVQPLNSNKCGEYCIFFASFRSKEVKFEKLLSYMQEEKNVLSYVNDLITS